MTEAALHRIGKMWVSIMKRKIRNSKKIATGNLLNSISYSVVKASDGEPILQINYADYWKYVNDGRLARGEDRPISAENGAVPIPALVKWIKVKGLGGALRRGRTSNQTLSLAFAIRASIWRYGIKPANFFDRSITKLESMLNPNNIPAGTPPELRQELLTIFDAAREDINIIIDNMVTNELKKE